MGVGNRPCSGNLWGREGAQGSESSLLPPLCLRLADWFPAFAWVCLLLSSASAPFASLGTSTPPAIAATPVSAIPAALGVNGYSPVPTQPTGQPATDALYPNGVHPYPGGGLCLPIPFPATSQATAPLAGAMALPRLRGSKVLCLPGSPAQRCSFPSSARKLRLSEAKGAVQSCVTSHKLKSCQCQAFPHHHCSVHSYPLISYPIPR